MKTLQKVNYKQGAVWASREEIKAPCHVTDGTDVYPLTIDMDGYINLYKVVGQSNLSIDGIPVIELFKNEDDIKRLANEWAITDGLKGEENLGTNSALNKGFKAGFKMAQYLNIISIEVDDNLKVTKINYKGINE